MVLRFEVFNIQKVSFTQNTEQASWSANAMDDATYKKASNNILAKVKLRGKPH